MEILTDGNCCNSPLLRFLVLRSHLPVHISFSKCFQEGNHITQLPHGRIFLSSGNMSIEDRSLDIRLQHGCHMMSPMDHS